MKQSASAGENGKRKSGMSASHRFPRIRRLACSRAFSPMSFSAIWRPAPRPIQNAAAYPITVPIAVNTDPQNAP
jgi:hypothetical protein